MTYMGPILNKLGSRRQRAPERADTGIAGADGFRLSLLDEFENSGLGWFWASDHDGNLTYLSGNAAETIQRPLEDLIGKPLDSLFGLGEADAQETHQRPLKFLVKTHQKLSDVVVRVASGADGQTAWWSIFGRPQHDAAGNFMGYRGNAKDITKSYQREIDVARLAEFDSLTGLANRHKLNQRLETILAAYRAAKRSCALMMLDLDRFKQVNDTLGHPAGDELLRQVAQRLQRLIGTHGEIGRLGGDEFQIILPDTDDRGDLGELAARIIQMISQPYSIEGSRVVIGTSAGIAIAPYDGLDRNELIRAADLALYAAKGGGRGQYRFYSTDLTDKAQERRDLEEDLRDALAHGQIELHYQPLVNPRTNRIEGCEALMRWNHPERGSVSPATFIPIAEESGLISQLGEWAVYRSTADAAAWPSPISVAVNISAQQFSDNSLPRIVAQALSKSGLDPQRLELEITESVFMGDIVAVDGLLARLKTLGVRLALDDFGTGYSSLSYLRRAPFDKMKIDQSFVRGCTERGNSNSAIVAAILDLARALKLTTTAEGVEALDELEFVRELNVDTVQGFIYGKAMPNDELIKRLETDAMVLKPSGPAVYRATRKSLFRRIGVIHEDYYYRAVLKNLSKTGAGVEGLVGVPVGTDLVIDLGEGQLAVCKVRRSRDANIGVQFETPLISDGAEGLCTRHRVSPYALAAAGMPLTVLPAGSYPLAKRADPAGHGKATFLEVEVHRRAVA
jgi:diguanylate cyclase (GGDEF)-like protein/PAS domain S-box-containing protein